MLLEKLILFLEQTEKYLGRIILPYWIIYLLVISGTILYQIWLIKKKGKGIKTAVWNFIAAGYFTTVLLITFCTRLPDPHISYELIPFTSHRRAIEDKSWQDMFLICVNIILFIPFGFITPICLKQKTYKEIGFIKTVLYAFAFTLCIETLQLITKVGCFETDDLINNTLGAVVGYLMYMIIKGIAFGFKNYIWH